MGEFPDRRDYTAELLAVHHITRRSFFKSPHGIQHQLGPHKQLEPVPERTGPYKTSKVFASVYIMASASCHVKNPCKKRKMRHERVLRPIARNRVVHQGAEASDRVKRRR